MIKRLKWIGFIALFTLLLTACGTNDEVKNPPKNSTPTENQQGTNTKDTNNTGDTSGANTNNNATSNPDYAFVDFDLEADFDGTTDTVDVDYEYEPNKVEASYDDKVQNIRLTGEEVMQELDSIFASFDFDENTPNDEVLKAVMKAFNIPDDATKVELDVEFANRTEKEYRK